MNLDEQKYPTGPVSEIRAGAESAKGLREENQDAMTRFLSRYGEVILVADGMGGHQGGATASDMVAKRYRLHLESMPPNMPLADALQAATARVNDEIYERGHSGDPAVAGMGSTLVLAVLTQGPNGWDVTVANAGDSRAYLVRDGMLRQLTKDHTAVQRMIDAGLLTEANARNHPNASVLTRALGQQAGTTVEVYPPFSLQGGDGLLLCSDGLAGYVVDAEIARVIAGAADPNGVVRSLVETALKSGSDDNITVQFLRIGDKATTVPMPPPPPPPGVPIVAVARRSKTGRNIAIAAAILAAALAWPAVQLIGKWMHPKPAVEVHQPGTDKEPGWVEGLKNGLKEKIPGGLDVKFSTAKIPPAFKPQKGIKISYRSGFEKELETIENIIKNDLNLTVIEVQHQASADLPPLVGILIVAAADVVPKGTQTLPGGMGPASPGQPNTEHPSASGSGGQTPRPQIDIHVPRDVRRPDWLKDLGNKIGGEFQPLTPEELKHFAPEKGIRISFREGMERKFEEIKDVMKHIPALKDIDPERAPKKVEEMINGVDVVIVAAPEIYRKNK